MLGDLGLARELGGTRDSRVRTSAGTGTLITMAPEATGGDYSPAGDMYSWAVTVCMVACHALPFPARPLPASRELILEAGKALLGAQCPAVADAVDLCLKTNHVKRPCATEVRDGLLQAVGVWPALGTCPSCLCGASSLGCMRAAWCMG
jgi:hypothetical protein